MNLVITKLNSRNVNYADTLANWAYQQWHRRNNTKLSTVKLDYRNRALSAGLPITWIACSDEQVIGMVSLKNKDLSSRNDLSPWLSALYVDPAFRNRGVARSLIDRLKQELVCYKIKKVYLFADRENTVELCAFYRRLGWCFFDEARDAFGFPVTIMSYTV